LKFPETKTKIYSILVVDLSECTYADIYSDAEIKIIFQDRSDVPNKHHKGGQSAARFARCRDNEITQWFKSINEKLKNVRDEIYLGINSVYQRRFIKTLTTYNQQKIKEVRGTEYTDLSGIFQYMKKLDEERNKKH